MSEKLSKNILKNTETLTNSLKEWYINLTNSVIEKLEKEKVHTEDLPVFKQVIEQLVADNTEDFKIRLGTEVITQWQDTDKYVIQQLRLKEKEIITDTITKKDTLPPHLVDTNNLSLKPSVVNVDNLTSNISNKKRIINTIKTTLDKFINNPLQNITKNDLTEFTAGISERITKGVRDSLRTPEKLFKIVPNEGAMNYLENRVFVASEKTLSKVGDNILNIISKKGKSEGLHPFEVARELRDEFTALSKRESERIARTEMLRANHSAKWERYQANETVEYIQWIHNPVADEPREDHMYNDGMIVRLGDPFPNGLRYPYDENSEPEDFMYCHCDYEAYFPEIGSVPPENYVALTEEHFIKDKDVYIPEFVVSIND